MIELHVLFDRNVEASVLFDGATAIHLRAPAGLDPLSLSLDFDEVIAQLQALKEQALEFLGQVPDRLTVYRRPDLPPLLSERLEAAAFAAGIEEFSTVGLSDIAKTLFSSSRGNGLLLLHTARDRISGVVLSRDANGAMVAIREATEPVDESSLRERIASALDRGPGTPPAGRRAAVHDIIDNYWAARAPLGLLEVREWGPGGWLVTSLSSADAAAIDDVTSQALRKLLDALVGGMKEAEIALIGEGQARVTALLAALMPNAHIVPFPATGLLDAMITLGRTGRRLSPNRGAEEGLPEARLLFDPRTDLGPNTVGLRRDNSAVSVFLDLGKRIQLDHIPAKWHRAGFDIEVILDGKLERVRLFKEHVGMDLRTFSARIASRWLSSSRLFIRIAIPELDTSAMLIAQGGRESIVAYHTVRRLNKSAHTSREIVE